MVEILNIKLYNNTLNKAVNSVSDLCSSIPQNRCMSATGAHGLVYAYKNTKFKEVLDNFFMNLPDGMPGVWIGRLKGATEMMRCYGPDFFREVLIATKGQNIRHYFCGGKEGIADKLKTICEERFGNKNVVGTHSPPFRDLTDEELKNLAMDINSKKTNIVWIGLSTPKQEIFAYRLSKFTNVNFICTVGAAFDFHTGKVREAPKWIQKIGMEWFFRLIMEPRRLWKRYIEIIPLFIWYNLSELVRGEFFKYKIEGEKH